MTSSTRKQNFARCTFVFGFIAAAQVSGLSASTLVHVIPHSGKSSVNSTSVAPYSDVWTSMWSPALTSVRVVVLIAVMPLEVIMASSMFSKAATFAAKAYVPKQDICS